MGLRRYERAVGDTVPHITSKTARFVPICTREDIGTKDDWAPPQRVFILSGIPKEMGIFNEISEEPLVPM
jgi:hypothetical protein